MIIRILIIFIFSFSLRGLGGFWGLAFAQNKAKIDSLLKVLKNAKEDTSKVNTLNEIVKQYQMIGDFEKGFKTAQSNLSLAQKLKFTKGSIPIHLYLGRFYYQKGDNKNALANYNQALQLAENLQDPNLMALAYARIGDFYQRTGKYAKALEYLLKSVKLANQLKDKTILAKNLQTLGNYYIAVGDYTQSLECGLKALKIAETKKDSLLTQPIHNLLGISYSSLKNFALGKAHFLKQMVYTNSADSISIAGIYNNLADLYIRQRATQPDSIAQALNYINKALTLIKKEDNKIDYTTFIVTLGEVYFLQKNYQDALKTLSEGLQVAQAIEDIAVYPYIYNVMGDIYSEQGNHTKALENYQKAMQTSVGEMSDLLHTYEGLLNTFTNQQDFKNAYTYQKKYHHLKDSLFSAETQLKAEANRVSFELEKQNDKITLLEKDKSLQAAQNQRTTLFLVLALVMVSVVVGLAIFLARRNQKQQKTNRQLQEKNEEIQQQAEELSQQAEELATQRDNLEQVNENVMLLSEIGKKITSSLQFKTIFGQLYENINQLMDATIFGVGIYQEDKQLISYELAMERGVAYLPYTRSMQDKTQLAVKCIEEKKEILINDMSHHLEHYTLKGTGELADGSESEEPQSLIYIPLLNNQEKILGVMSVQAYQKDAYNDYHLNILRNLAIYTSIAIENAENLQALDDEKRNLEGKNQELEALTEELRQ
ncbi:MAG: tetratricopeptide repeat protein [Microscillaceae bacterium]|nr:tetratricopeptide repeat protein [Microscillaceae bacterium]